MPVCARRQMAHPSLTKAFLQAAATATMHCQAERWTYPPLPVPPFLLAPIFKMVISNRWTGLLDWITGLTFELKLCVSHDQYPIRCAELGHMFDA